MRPVGAQPVAPWLPDQCRGCRGAVVERENAAFVEDVRHVRNPRCGLLLYRQARTVRRARGKPRPLGVNGHSGLGQVLATSTDDDDLAPTTVERGEPERQVVEEFVGEN